MNNQGQDYWEASIGTFPGRDATQSFHRSQAALSHENEVIIKRERGGIVLANRESGR